MVTRLIVRLGLTMALLTLAALPAAAAGRTLKVSVSNQMNIALAVEVMAMPVRQQRIGPRSEATLTIGPQADKGSYEFTIMVTPAEGNYAFCRVNAYVNYGGGGGLMTTGGPCGAEQPQTSGGMNCQLGQVVTTAQDCLVNITLR